MPFNDTTKRFDRVWRFVDQFLATENATRTSFDVTIDDVRDALNSAIAYLEGRDDDIAVSATDLRYIGAFSVTPITRVGGGALALGDFYFDTDDEEFLVFNGTSFVTTTGLTTAMRAFLALIEADDYAAVRTLIGLGTAATQNSSAFATAAQGAKADGAILAPSGIANTVLDWHTVHTSGTNVYYGAAGAANSIGANASVGFYWKATTTSGILFVFDLITGKIGKKICSASAFGSWIGIVETGLDSVVNGGVTSTAIDDGTKSTGTYSLTPVGGNMRHAVNNGAFTLAAPTFAGDYSMTVQIVNGATAGAISMSGFARVQGSPFTTTNGHKFNLYITRLNGAVTAFIEALQ